MKNINFYKLALLLPSYAWLLFYVLLPLLIILSISFSEYTEARLPFKIFFEFNSTSDFHFKPLFENFIYVLNDNLFLKSIKNSCKISTYSTICCLFICYPLAYSIFLCEKKYRSILLLLAIIPFWTSMLIRIYSLIVILGDNGLINNFLKIIGISSTNFITLNSNFSLIITMAYTYLPFMIVPIYSSLEKIDHSLFEAAADLGAKKTKIFIKIIFPLSSTGVMLGCLLVFIASFGEYVIPDLLGSNTITIGKLIWSEFFYNRDWVAAATMTIIIILIAIVPFILLNRYLLRAKNVT